MLLKACQADGGSIHESGAENAMSTGPKQNHNGESTNFPQWADCDYFCIHD